MKDFYIFLKLSSNPCVTNFLRELEKNHIHAMYDDSMNKTEIFNFLENLPYWQEHQVIIKKYFKNFFSEK
jgi:hypothetical protein